MAGIQLGGLASGLDTNAIIDQLMAAERTPRTRLTLRQSAEQAREAALNNVSSKLSALRDAAQALASRRGWDPVQTITSSDAAKVSARQLSGTGPGSYTVAVTQLATSDQHTYTYTPPAAADTLTIGGATISLAAGATVDEAVAAINASSDAGVFAVAVDLTGSGTKSLVLSARATGTPNAFTATGGALAEQASRARPARDAVFSIDGGASQTSSSNVVTNGIPGVELTLHATTSALNVTVGDPGVDRGQIVGGVKAFVDAYNAAVDLLRSASSDKPVANPTTTFEAARGALYADTTVRSALDALRSTVRQAFDDIAGATGPKRLAQIGISTGATTGGSAYSADAVAGKLTFDTTAFNAALDSDQSGVQRLLGAGGVSGLAQRMQDALAPFIQAGGLIAGRVSAAQSSQRSLADQIASFDRRASQREDLLRRQFTTLETSLSRIQAQGADLAARLGLNTGR